MAEPKFSAQPFDFAGEIYLEIQILQKSRKRCCSFVTDVI
jgi:hypothetical protein